MMWKKHQEPHRHDGSVKTESCANSSPQYFDLKERIHTRVIELMDMSVVATMDFGSMPSFHPSRLTVPASLSVGSAVTSSISRTWKNESRSRRKWENCSAESCCRDGMC